MSSGAVKHVVQLIRSFISPPSPPTPTLSPYQPGYDAYAETLTRSRAQTDMPPSSSRKTMTNSSTLSRGRASSEELGEGDFAINYNRRTGRPIRNSAGQRSLDPDYVDPTEVIAPGNSSDRDGEEEIGTEDEQDDAGHGEVQSGRKKKGRKRARSPDPPPSPSPPPLSPMPPEEALSRSSSPSPLPTPADGLDPLMLVFNIPLGFQGPLEVKIDPPSLLERVAKRQRTSSGVSRSPSQTRSYRTAIEENDPVDVTASAAQKIGFLSLPGELRNKIYRLLFVASEPLDFFNPHNFCRSGRFLGTCAQIYDEGRSILYGENTFRFERNKSTRAPYWSSKQREVGFKDIRLFLKSIGPSNISMMRQLGIVFDDAMPSHTPYLRNQEERRFVHDEHLFDCLKILGRHAKLKSLKLSFHGRKNLLHTDRRFLEILRTIKADEVSIIPHPRSAWGYPPLKIHYDLKSKLINEMTRIEKLYEDEK